MMAVSSGLQEGDRVIVDGVDRVREGAKVEVVQPGAPAGTRRTAPDGSGRARDTTPEQRDAFKKKMENLTPEQREEFRKRREGKQ